jgi:hypothetical protein
VSFPVTSDLGSSAVLNGHSAGYLTDNDDEDEEEVDEEGEPLRTRLGARDRRRLARLLVYEITDVEVGDGTKAQLCWCPPYLPYVSCVLVYVVLCEASDICHVCCRSCHRHAY